MKKTMTYLLLLAGTLLLAGCQKEGRVSNGNGEIRFMASSRPETKTEYGGYYKKDNNVWTPTTNPDEATWQSINWKNGDILRIYSDKAKDRYFDHKYADYIVINAEPGSDTDPTSTARLSNATAAYLADPTTIPDPTNDPGIPNPSEVDSVNGLVWGEAGDYKFYGIYPVPDGLTDAQIADGSAGNLHAHIPDNQDYSVAGNLTEYGFITAYGKEVIQTAGGEGLADDFVGLEFSPAFTAFEFKVKSAGDAIGVTTFELMSDKKALAGDYVIHPSSAPRYTFPTSGGKTITMDLNKSIGSDYLTFTVLALPQTYDDLSIRFTTTQNVQRTLDLRTAAGENVTFAPDKKHRIYGLALPNGELLVSVGTAPWDEGSESSYTTIEDAFILFDYNQTRLFLNGQQLWNDTRIAIAPGYETVHVDPLDPTSATTERPMYSPLFSLNTVSVGVKLKLVSDNPAVGFVKLENGVYTPPSAELEIPASVVTTEKPYGTEVETSYFVVPMTGAATDGSVRAGISLIRQDNGVPVAYTHQYLPGSTEHTKILYQVITPEKYTNNTIPVEGTF